MEIFMELPKTRKGKDKLARDLAKFHAEVAARMIKDLPCPVEQKLKLVDAVVNDALKNKQST